MSKFVINFIFDFFADSLRRVVPSCSNLLAVSKWQNFIIAPPQLFPVISKSSQYDFYKNSYFMLQTYSDEEVTVHRVASNLMFQGEVSYCEYEFSTRL